DDTIVYDAADNLASVLGGSGTDKLIVNGGTVPLSFDLTSHGFELATHNRIDSGSEAWATITDNYNASWDIFYRTENRDDGEIWYTTWDTDGSEIWSTLTNMHDVNSQLYQQVGFFDTGNTWNLMWDVDNSETWSRQISVDDIANLRSWNTHTNCFDDQNRVYNQQGTYDSGNTWNLIWDVDNTETWSRQINADDVANLRTWNTHTNFFDDQNRLYNQLGTYDSGNTWNLIWDVDNTETWARQIDTDDVANLETWNTYTNFFDDQNRLYNQQGTHDSGNTWNLIWDVDNTETWSQQINADDVANLRNWNTHTNFIDDQNRLYSQQGTYDNGNTWHKIWDVENAESWSLQSYLYDPL
ncbi:MAG: hypothetical protein GY943_23230, partial [Chloroflexi bacterium]|nr:hypothetical protein [Chloroflexota bacterium]